MTAKYYSVTDRKTGKRYLLREGFGPGGSRVKVVDCSLTFWRGTTLTPEECRERFTTPVEIDHWTNADLRTLYG